jgi:hypothetical protein
MPQTNRCCCCCCCCYCCCCGRSLFRTKSGLNFGEARASSLKQLNACHIDLWCLSCCCYYMVFHNAAMVFVSHLLSFCQLLPENATAAVAGPAPSNTRQHICFCCHIRQRKYNQTIVLNYRK